MYKAGEAVESDDSRENSDSDGEPAPRMRVGEEYQADIPEQIGTVDEDDREPHAPSTAAPMKVWCPDERIGEAQLESFVSLAKEKYNYSLEQAMGMLYWHKYDVVAAREDLCNFTPFPDEWSLEDKVIFEQAFQSHGKSFRRIRSMLPDKTVGSLVKYYYSWKKTRCRTSHIDRQARRLARAQDESESDGEQASHSNSDSDFDPGKSGGGKNGDGGAVRRRGGGDADAPPSKRRVKLPKGMYLDKATLVDIARSGNEEAIDRLNSESVALRRSIQQNKQQLSQSEETLRDRSMEEMRPPDIQRRVVSRWTDDEMQMAVEALRRYGKDFNAIANVVGNKTVQQCRNFYMNYRRKYNLDSVLEEFEAKQASERGDGVPMTTAENDADEKTARGDEDADRENGDDNSHGQPTADEDRGEQEGMDVESAEQSGQTSAEKSPVAAE